MYDNLIHVHFLNLKPFGCEKGDRVSYSFSGAGTDFKNPVIALRYRTVTDGNAVFDMNGREIVLKNSNELTFAYLPYMEEFTLESSGGAGVELDFLAVIEEGDKALLYTENVPFDYVPEITTQVLEKGHRTRLTYNGVDAPFYIMTGNKNTRERILESGSLEDALINRLSNGDHTSPVGFLLAITLRDILLGKIKSTYSRYIKNSITRQDNANSVNTTDMTANAGLFTAPLYVIQ